MDMEVFFGERKQNSGWLRNRTGTGNRNRQNRFFPKPKAEPEPPEPFSRTSFPCFFGQRQGKPPKKQGFFFGEPLESLRKKGKTAKKNRNSLQKKKSKEFQKSKDPVQRKIRAFSRNRNRNRNRPFLFNSIETQKNLFTEEPPEPKTGTARTVPPPNRNRTEPNRGFPGTFVLAQAFFFF